MKAELSGKRKEGRKSGSSVAAPLPSPVPEANTKIAMKWL